MADKESLFVDAEHYSALELEAYRGWRLASSFTSLSDEYKAACEHAALFDRSHRGLLIARGADRKEWLHNLVTNAVKTLDDRTGCYAFAIDVKGRVQFDLNILDRGDELWLDIDDATVSAVKAHLERYLITEDVELEVASQRFARLGCAGARAADVAKRLGVTNLTAMASLSSANVVPDLRVRRDGNAVQAVLFRHDFARAAGFELVVEADLAAAWWDWMVAEAGARPAGMRAAELLRIETGIPAWGFDIDHSVIPPETGQIERGISYQKGCYLGQEIIERMRSFGSLGRRLTRFALDDGEGLALPARIECGGAEAGRLTSLARHPIDSAWIGLGYLRTSVGDDTELTVGDPPRPVRIRGGD